MRKKIKRGESLGAHQSHKISLYTVYEASQVKVQKDDFFLPYHSNSLTLVRFNDRTEWRHV